MILLLLQNSTRLRHVRKVMTVQMIDPIALKNEAAPLP